MIIFVILVPILWVYSVLIGRIKRCEIAIKKLESRVARVTASEIENSHSSAPHKDLDQSEDFSTSIKIEAEAECVKTPSYSISTAQLSSKQSSVDREEPENSTCREKSGSTTKFTQPSSNPESSSKRARYFRLPTFIKENWLGVFGSIALVAGAVFFGLTAEIMQQPQARVAVMLLASLLFFVVGYRLKSSGPWSGFGGTLKAIAGAVILFTAVGSSGIEGLKCIDSSLYAGGFLSIGIVINLLLAISSASQILAGFHVLLSIVALCLTPQAVFLLPMGMIVGAIGLFNSYRSKWNLNFLMITISFAFQNFYWSLELGKELLPLDHGIAVGCSIVIGVLGSLIHYSKKYTSSNFEPFSLATHAANLGFLILNIWLHAPFLKWIPLLFGSMAIVGFFLARKTQKNGISWLYHTDILFSQLLALSSILSIGMLSVGTLDICILVFMETLIFTLVFQVMQNRFIARIGGGCLLIVSLILMLLFLNEWLISFAESDLALFLRLGVVITGIGIYYLLHSRKRCEILDVQSIFSAKRDSKHSLPIAAILGGIFFSAMYLIGFRLFFIQAVSFLAVTALIYWRKYREDSTTDLVFAIVLISMHVLNWLDLTSSIFLQKNSMTLLSSYQSLGLLSLEIFLIGGNFLEFKLWKKNLSSMFIYAFGLQLGLVAYAFTKGTNTFTPGFVFLGLSVAILEVAKSLPKRLKINDKYKLRVEESFIQVGYAYLICFIIHFLTVQLQINPVWHSFSLRWVAELFGISTIFYWLAFCPRRANYLQLTQAAQKNLVEICLGLITLCILLETSEFLRPLFWAGMSVGLLVGNIYFSWSKRLCRYSWFYFIASIGHMAFVTSTLKMPKLFWIETSYLFILLTIVLQATYACLVYLKQSEIRAGLQGFSSSIYRYKNLNILLPNFLGVALLLAFNFEKALLTLLWVGLICAYMSVGLLVRSKSSIQIGTATLIFCATRLLIFDLVQSDLGVRAIVFIGVGVFSLTTSVLYKKYKHRIITNE